MKQNRESALSVYSLFCAPTPKPAQGEPPPSPPKKTAPKPTQENHPQAHPRRTTPKPTQENLPLPPQSPLSPLACRLAPLPLAAGGVASLPLCPRSRPVCRRAPPVACSLPVGARLRVPPPLVCAIRVPRSLLGSLCSPACTAALPAARLRGLAAVGGGRGAFCPPPAFSRLPAVARARPRIKNGVFFPAFRLRRAAGAAPPLSSPV